MKMAYFLQINCTNSEMVYRRNTETNELEISTVSQKAILQWLKMNLISIQVLMSYTKVQKQKYFKMVKYKKHGLSSSFLRFQF